MKIEIEFRNDENESKRGTGGSPKGRDWEENGVIVCA